MFFKKMTRLALIKNQRYHKLSLAAGAVSTVKEIFENLIKSTLAEPMHISKDRTPKQYDFKVKLVRIYAIEKVVPTVMKTELRSHHDK